MAAAVSAVNNTTAHTVAAAATFAIASAFADTANITTLEWWVLWKCGNKNLCTLPDIFVWKLLSLFLVVLAADTVERDAADLATVVMRSKF